ncbi:MAG: cytidine deaminase [Acidobacteriota bacterium]
MSAADPLVEAARAARARAVAPFSHFAVGAALESDDGRVFAGCNIENASYGLTVCAERVAIFKAVSEGVRAFRRLVVVADAPTPTPPCGACRQIIWEFCGDIEIILAGPAAVHASYRMKTLLPHPFDRGSLGGSGLET